MFCQACSGKTATVQINHHGRSISLCRECAIKELASQGEPGAKPTAGGIPPELAQLAKSAPPGGIPHMLVLQLPGGIMPAQAQAPDVKCSTCDGSYREFLEKGLFHCPGCYESFASQIRAHRDRTGKAGHYKGKIPARAFRHLKTRKLINDLRGQLQDEVVHENYETAARLRDTIRNLEDEVEKRG